MITIFVNSKCFNATLSYPEYKKIARDYIPDVLRHIAKTPNCVIETCSEGIVNIMGQLIYDKYLKPTDVILIVEDKQYHYGEDGCLLDWMYGYFLPPELKRKKVEPVVVEEEDDGPPWDVGTFISMCD
jgi:hypothetical protein